MSQLAEEFVRALKRLEDSGDADAIVALFGANATVSNPLLSEHGQTEGDPSKFWRDYRGSFDKITSEFKAVVSQDGASFLEWVSEGTLDGKSFRYGGVSVLDEKDGKIAAFRTYFDPRQLPPAQKTTDGRSELDRAQQELAEQRAEGGYA